MNARCMLTPALLAAMSAGFFSKACWAEEGKPDVKGGQAQPAAQQQLDLALGFSAAFEKVAADVSPSVVNITATMPAARMNSPYNRFFGDPAPQVSAGSGVIISKDGYIITNSHVVNGAAQLEVRLSDESKHAARVIGTDPATDVALIKIEGDSFVPASLGDSNSARAGQWVLAIGSPYNLSQTVTAGIVSAAGRRMQSERQQALTAYDNFIQTDASINPGNSGGPLVNLKGEVIGINSAIFSRSGGSVGVGFAIPINLARTVAESLKDLGSLGSGGYLGVNMASPAQYEQLLGSASVPTDGVLIAEVPEGSPASKAGLKAGDVIQSINGLPTRDGTALSTVVRRIAPGKTVPVGYSRGGKSQQVEVTLASLPKELQPVVAATTGVENALGVSVRELTSEAARQAGLNPRVKGVQIVEIGRESVFRDTEVEPGAVILSINGKPTGDIEAFNLALAAASKSRTTSVRVYSAQIGDMTLSIRNR